MQKYFWRKKNGLGFCIFSAANKSTTRKSLTSARGSRKRGLIPTTMPSKKNLTDDQRRQIIDILLINCEIVEHEDCNSMKLTPGLVQDVVKQFEVHRNTVGNLWRRARENDAKGKGTVVTNQRHRCGRKRVQRKSRQNTAEPSVKYPYVCRKIGYTLSNSTSNNQEGRFTRPHSHIEDTADSGKQVGTGHLRLQSDRHGDHALPKLVLSRPHG